MDVVHSTVEAVVFSPPGKKIAKKHVRILFSGEQAVLLSSGVRALMSRPSGHVYILRQLALYSFVLCKRSYHTIHISICLELSVQT